MDLLLFDHISSATNACLQNSASRIASDCDTSEVYFIRISVKNFQKNISIEGLWFAWKIK